MPVYEYECGAHGVFEMTKSIAEYGNPAYCPECGGTGRRLLSAPRLACMPRSEVIARDRNERSQHEPKIVRASERPRENESPGFRSSHGLRPWVLEHG